MTRSQGQLAERDSRAGQLRQSVVSLKEELHSTRLELEVLAQDNAELDEVRRKTDMDKGEKLGGGVRGTDSARNRSEWERERELGGGGESSYRCK